MLAICICYIYVELGPTYTWHICKYMGSIWDWEKEKKTSKPTASLWNWPIKLNWSSLNREMDACLWEDRIVFDFVHLYLYRQVFLITIFTSFVLHYYHIGSSSTCIILLTKQLQVLMKNFRLNFLWSSIATPCCLKSYIICVALKWFSVIQETNYPSVNIPKLCVLHTVFKLDFEKLISMSTSLSKTFSVFQNALYLNLPHV